MLPEGEERGIRLNVGRVQEPDPAIKKTGQIRPVIVGLFDLLLQPGKELAVEKFVDRDT